MNLNMDLRITNHFPFFLYLSQKKMSKRVSQAVMDAYYAEIITPLHERIPGYDPNRIPNPPRPKNQPMKRVADLPIHMQPMTIEKPKLNPKPKTIKKQPITTTITFVVNEMDASRIAARKVAAERVAAVLRAEQGDLSIH